MPGSRRDAVRDAALYAGAALWAGGVAAFASIPLYREWGRLAVAPYAVGAVVALALAWVRAGIRARVWLALAVFAGAALLPLGLEVAWRAGADPGQHAQSEAIVTEEAAKALLDGRNPYQATYLEGPLAGRPLGTKTHFPYLPGMLVFGLPRALDGGSPAADARLAFAGATLAVTGICLHLWRTTPGRRLMGAQVLLILPTGALPMATGGDDPPVLALMLLSLVLLARGTAGLGGLAAGLAAGIKQTAWPLLPFLILAAWALRGRRGGVNALAAATAAASTLVLPFVAWNPSAFVEDVVLFPLGLGEQPTAAGSATLGTLVLEAFPRARSVLTVVLLATVAGVAIYVLTRRSTPTASRAALHAGIVMTVALLLAPAARFGYVIYPMNLLAWAALLRSPTVLSRTASSLDAAPLSPPD